MRGKIGITFSKNKEQQEVKQRRYRSKYNISSSEIQYHLSVSIVRHPILNWVVHRLALLMVRGVISLVLLRVPRLGKVTSVIACVGTRLRATDATAQILLLLPLLLLNFPLGKTPSCAICCLRSRQQGWERVGADDFLSQSRDDYGT